MTVEIGVLNRLGVALATDSAATLRSGNKMKVHSSADKLFQMREGDPVGIMVYGDSDFLGVPWETIVKTYKNKRAGSAPLPRVGDYARDFVDFLAKNRDLFPSESQRTDVDLYAERVSLYVIRELGKALEKELEDRKEQLIEADIKAVLADVISRELTKSRSVPTVKGMGSRFRDGIRRKYSATIKQGKTRGFERLPLSSAASRNFSSLVFELLTRQMRDREGRLKWVAGYSGLVVAGFGAKEHFPVLTEVCIQGMLSNTPLCYRTREFTISRQNKGEVVACAQDDMVSTFMYGIDPWLRLESSRMIKDKFLEVAEAILAEVENEEPGIAKRVRKRSRAQLSRILWKSYAELTDVQKRRHHDPVMKIVSALQKDELAAMARELVDLTKFKRRMSPQSETVGGPIDVAVITKGDGFIWVDRKHYFRPELNPRVVLGRGGS